MKNMVHKNTDVEVLKRLLTGEIHSRAKINLISCTQRCDKINGDINDYYIL
ncbi:MAG: DUF3387 domain-containing protein [Deltaproteobacteria bacterium]|nr:DUF3387 domain-containing protein [Deltaproteobacteria bacterium]